MTIDLRYIICFASFYAPGFMLLTGAWLLGYSIAEVRETIAVIGLVMGFMLSLVLAVALFLDGKSIPFSIGGKKQ
jgi:hypothetical protein